MADGQGERVGGVVGEILDLDSEEIGDHLSDMLLGGGAVASDHLLGAARSILVHRDFSFGENAKYGTASGSQNDAVP